MLLGDKFVFHTCGKYHVEEIILRNRRLKYVRFKVIFHTQQGLGTDRSGLRWGFKFARQYFRVKFGLKCLSQSPLALSIPDGKHWRSSSKLPVQIFCDKKFAKFLGSLIRTEISLL